MSTEDSVLKISIILPLFDRRDAGWESLRSALAQRFPRDRYEIVAVTARSHMSAAGDPEIAAALARCDVVVRTDIDDTVAANEIQLYLAGYQRCTGQLVLFCEGHTVLREDCCVLIDEYFLHHRNCDLAWAPRLNHAVSPLGELIAMHNDRHQRRALVAGVFSLGANSVIRRTTFEALGGLDARYLRFGETVLFHRALERGAVIGRMPAPLALHYNDMPVALWRQLAQDTGAGRFAYYDELLAQGNRHDGRIRHPIYVQARRSWIAALLAPLLRAAGLALIRAAATALRIDRGVAYRCYVLALGCADLAGYTRAAADADRNVLQGRKLGIRSRQGSRRVVSGAGDQPLDAGNDLTGIGRPDALDQSLREVGQEVA